VTGAKRFGFKAFTKLKHDTKDTVAVRANSEEELVRHYSEVLHKRDVLGIIRVPVRN
jgi:hypothetical protein